MAESRPHFARAAGPAARVAPPLSAIVARLRELRTRFDGAAAERLALLAAARRAAARDARTLSEYHELLLWHCAYPDSARVARAAQDGLRQLALFIGDAAQQARLPAWLRRLDDSGITGTTLHLGLSFDLMDWLAREFPADVELDWDELKGSEELELLFQTLASRGEYDGLLDERLSSAAWLELSAGERGAAAQVRALFDLVRGSGATLVVRDRLFESARVWMRWRLRDARASRSLGRFPARPIFAQRAALLRDVDPAALLRRPLPSARPMPARQAQDWIDAARLALAVRQRETEPVTWANPREATVFRLERGVDVLLLGLSPQRRLPIESFFGYVAARNGVPCAYGGGWVFLERCEIGINIFETFRGGESAFLFAQILRVYLQHFRVSRFVVDPFQFGAANREGLRSGAIWFYYRFGFRPADARLRALADEEWERLRRQPGSRSAISLLKRLAGAKLELDLRGAPLAAPGAARAPELTLLGRSATRRIGAEFGGDRRAALAACCRALREELRIGARPWAALSTAQREWFAEWSVLLGGAARKYKWNAAQRENVRRVVLAKGALRERDFALALQRSAVLRRALSEIANEESRQPPRPGGAKRA